MSCGLLEKFLGRKDAVLEVSEEDASDCSGLYELLMIGQLKPFKWPA